MVDGGAAHKTAVPSVPFTVGKRVEPFYFAAGGKLHNAALAGDELLFDAEEEVLVIGEGHGAVEVAADFEGGLGTAKDAEPAAINATDSGSNIGGAANHGGGGFAAEFTAVEGAVGLFVEEKLLADFGCGKSANVAGLSGIGREDGEVSVFERDGGLAPDNDGGGITVAAVRGGGAGVVTPENFSGGVGNAVEAVGGAVSPMLAEAAAAAHDEGVA